MVNENYQDQPPFRVTFRDREKGEKSPSYYQSILLKNSLEAIKKAGIKITPKLIENLGQVAVKFGGITGNKEELSFIDPLTGLYNRRFFEEAGKDRMAESKRYGLPLIFGSIDLDNFKVLNDEYSHVAGDNFLQIFGQLLRTNLKREEDICARLGGDEFGFIIFGSDLSKTNLVVENLRKDIQKLIDEQFQGLSKPLGFSVGIKEWDGKSPISTMMKRTDKELYREKKEKHG